MLLLMWCWRTRLPEWLLNAKEKYQFFWFCVKTITSAPSLIVLVLKPFPSDTTSSSKSNGRGSRHQFDKELEKTTQRSYIAQWKHQTAYLKIQSSCNISAPLDPFLLHHLVHVKHHKIIIKIKFSMNWADSHLFILLNLPTLNQQWGAPIPWICKFINTNKRCPIVHLTEKMQQNKPYIAFMFNLNFF